MKLSSAVVAVIFIVIPCQQLLAVELNGQEVPKENLVAWIFIGHSNMAGRYLKSVDFTVDADNIWKLRYGDWDKAEEPYSVNANWGGPCNFFLREMVDQFPPSQYPDIHHAVINNGKTQRKTWHYHEGNDGYDEIMGWINQYKDEMTIAGMFVLLGYMERSDSYNEFSNNAQQVISDFRDGLGMPNLPVVWGAMENSGGNGDVHRAIQDLPDKIDNVYINQIRGPCGDYGSDKDRCNGGDHHFNWYGYEKWGQECVSIIIDKGLMPNPCDQNDSQPPSAPHNVIVADKTGMSVTLEWTQSTDNQTVSGYQLYDGNDLLDEIGGNGSSGTFDGLSPATTYNLTMKAKDCAGNLSDPSNPVQFTTEEPAYAELPLRVNVGGSAAGGFSADKPFQTGDEFGYTADSDHSLAQEEMVEGAGDNLQVFQTVRWQDFDYTILAPAGRYTVNLLFAEFWRSSSGGREFSVTINGEPISHDPLDVCEVAGGQSKALTVSENIETAEHQIVISARNIHNDQSHEPILSGIEILPGSATAISSSASASAISWSLTGNALIHSRALAGQKAYICDLRGRRLAACRLTAEKTPLPIAALGTGLYIIQIGSGKLNSVKKSRTLITQ